MKNCLDNLRFPSKKLSSQSIKSGEESFDVNGREIWGADNRDDSRIFVRKFENLKFQTKNVQTKFFEEKPQVDNFSYNVNKEPIGKIENNYMRHDCKPNPNQMSNLNLFFNNSPENIYYAYSNNISPNFNSTDMRRMKQNFVGNNNNQQMQQQMHQPMPQNMQQQYLFQNGSMGRNFVPKSVYFNNENQFNQRGMQKMPTVPLINQSLNPNLTPTMNQLNQFNNNVNQMNMSKKSMMMQHQRNQDKNKRDYHDEEYNKINLERVLKKRDKRTTLMIRHIPNKYNIKTFLEELNLEFLNKYDVFYLPIDYVNNCNLGFAFINFVDPMHVILFYERYRGKKWTRFQSEKICELAYAKFQGKKELIAHFEKGSVLNFVSEDKRPLILSVPTPLPKVEIPFKYVNAFKQVYPYGAYVLTGKDTVSIEALYSF